MGWIQQAEQLWSLGKALLKTSSVAEPSLRFALPCLNRKATGINLGFRDSVAAEATRSPFDYDLAFRRFT